MTSPKPRDHEREAWEMFTDSTECALDPRGAALAVTHLLAAVDQIRGKIAADLDADMVIEAALRDSRHAIARADAAQTALGQAVRRAELAEAELARQQDRADKAEHDRDEWRQSTIAANRRYEALESVVRELRDLHRVRKIRETFVHADGSCGECTDPDSTQPFVREVNSDGDTWHEHALPEHGWYCEHDGYGWPCESIRALEGTGS